MRKPAESAGWRCFVAVPLSDAVRVSLAASVDGWRHQLDARWTDPVGWHISLHFIGSVSPGGVRELARSLADGIPPSAEGDAFEVTVGGVGALPNARRARVLYSRVSDQQRRLEHLADAARTAAARVVETSAQARRFVPHITLARLRTPHSLAEWMEGAGTESMTLSVSEVCLMRSHLGRGPARYEAIARFAVGRSGVAA